MNSEAVEAYIATCDTAELLRLSLIIAERLNSEHEEGIYTT